MLTLRSSTINECVPEKLLDHLCIQLATCQLRTGEIMKSISQVMTRDVTVVKPDDSLQHAAQLMRDMNIGALPVCNGKRLVGMITDRDITIRAVAEGKSPSNVHVSDVMSDQPLWCFDDQTVGEVLQQMGDQQIRRIPVISRDAMELVGVVSLGDLATEQGVDTDSTLGDISAPIPPDRPSTGTQPSRH
jgi:CBS domain-containing protein